MPWDAGRFVQAMMTHGFTLEEAKSAAEMIVHGETIRRPPYPCSMAMVLGRRPCQITADLEGNSLVLKSI